MNGENEKYIRNFGWKTRLNHQVAVFWVMKPFSDVVSSSEDCELDLHYHEIHASQNNIYDVLYMHSTAMEHIKFRECLLSFSSECFVFPSRIKKLNIKICKTVVLPGVLYGCETWSHFEGGT
jgi:hypothetical protein